MNANFFARASKMGYPIHDFKRNIETRYNIWHFLRT